MSRIVRHLDAPFEAGSRTRDGQVTEGSGLEVANELLIPACWLDSCQVKERGSDIMSCPLGAAHTFRLTFGRAFQPGKKSILKRAELEHVVLFLLPLHRLPRLDGNLLRIHTYQLTLRLPFSALTHLSGRAIRACLVPNLTRRVIRLVRDRVPSFIISLVDVPLALELALVARYVMAQTSARAEPGLCIRRTHICCTALAWLSVDVR